MSSVFNPVFILRTLSSVALALFASIAWGLAREDYSVSVLFAVVGWLFSLANALFAAVLLYYSRKPGLSMVVAAAALVFYPVIQHFWALNSSGRGMVLELSQLINGGYLVSGMIVLPTMYFAAEATTSDAE